MKRLNTHDRRRRRELVIGRAVAANFGARDEQHTHAYCDLCKRITPLVREPLTQPSTDGLYPGGDCGRSACGSILPRVFRARE